MKSNQPIKWQSLWPLLLPVLIFIPGISGFPYSSIEAQYSDLAITHYPNAIFLKSALREYGAVPLWSPTILSGYPFAANPLSGLWYPPGWLAVFMPLPLGFNILAMLHLLWGGVGLFIFFKTEGLSNRAALLGSLAFESLPKIFAHYGAGHLTLVYAISWTPWLLFASRHAVPQVKRLFQPLCIVVMILADPRWAAYGVSLWFIYMIAYSQIDLVSDSSPKLSLKIRLKALLASLKTIISGLVLAVLLSAPLILPLLEFTRLSTRATMSGSDTLVLSLPPVRLLGLFFPDFGGNHEFILYSGGLVIILVLISAFKDNLKFIEKIWLGVGLGSLILALGSNLPGFEYAAKLPGFSLLRVPSRALFLTGMAFAIVAAYSLDDLLTNPRIFNFRRISLTLTGFVAVTGMLAGGVWFLTQSLPINFVWGAVMVLAGSLWVGLRLKNQVPPGIWFPVLIGILLLDWGGLNYSTLSFRPTEVTLAEKSGVTQFLHQQDGYFRTYSPSYSLPQQIAVHADIEMADGVDPLQLAGYREFMTVASGVPASGYAVTIPPYANGDPAVDNAAYWPNAERLGRLNVRYVLSEFDLVSDDLIFQTQVDTTRIYENRKFLPRAWVQKTNDGLGENWAAASIQIWEPNRIEIKAYGPGLLVLSEIYYPGWRVLVDNQQTELQTYDQIFRAVELAPGPHEIELEFRPVSVYAGLGLFGWGVGWIIFRHKRYSTKPKI
jgi:hypothetical protein